MVRWWWWRDARARRRPRERGRWEGRHAHWGTVSVQHAWWRWERRAAWLVGREALCLPQGVDLVSELGELCRHLF